MDQLLNPPSDVKARMCAEYLKGMALRHVGAVGEYKAKVQQIADLQTTKVRQGRDMASFSPVMLKGVWGGCVL